ncbi:thioredoxin-like domain-containing protein [Planctomicrobium piriforme]|uniref:Thiol-disulfide isomerase or thioredoxin n=1 Tax=Planctomicrobium piriforme TaxID=1576369 RepID=A0A1I3SD65_9PLAN|nr:thioredoxin-like domain-containing protein [Planctomicrobium piriforme]SFJ55491.1 Thiol-disulfide isomerase or thioredoxin [Planctomicrobium piriforme]
MSRRFSVSIILTLAAAIAWLAPSRSFPLLAEHPRTGNSPIAAQPLAANQTENPFPGRFPAPSFDGGTEWLNTSGPISLQDLRGKIVILDFWTYCCINCMHILPDLKYLEQKYPNELVVIGVHSAKFDNEKESENIREAIMRYEIAHPVVNDSEMTIARKYQFSSWPTLVLIDPEGNFVGRQPGEGNRELFDEVIGKMVAYHRAKGTLDEKPVKFNLEREKVEPTPLRFPGKVLADEAGGRLFITDSNHNRIVISSFTGQLLDIIGTGAIGAKDGGYAEASFDHPQGVALVKNDLYVADTENHLIRKIDLKKKQVATLAGTGVQSHVRPTFGGGGTMRKTALNSPWSIVELKDHLYVAMAGPHQLWRHHLGSDSIVPFVGSGREDIIDGPLRESALAQPSDIVTDGQVLYHVDSEGSAVRRDDVGPRAHVSTVVGPHDIPQGQSLFAFGDIDGVGDAVRLQHPIGLAIHNGSLYVADTYNDKIKKVDPVARTAVTWLGTGERGKGLEPVELFEPSGIAIAGNTMYIADTNNHRILATDLTTKKTREFVVNGLTPPTPPKTTEEEPYAGKTDDLPSSTVSGAGPLTVQVNFELPFEHELNQLAPLSYKVTVNGSQSVIDPEVIGKRKRAEADKTSATFTIPLTGKAGTTEVTLTVNYQYCKHGTGGVCRFATQQWKLPLTVASQGTDRITLTAKP